MRYNYTLFNADSLPPWAEGDSLLGQRLQSIAVLAQVLRDEPSRDTEHMQTLFEAFQGD